MKILKKDFKLNSKFLNNKFRGLLRRDPKTTEKADNSAFSYDRDKNIFYRPNDESTKEAYEEIYDDDGYRSIVRTSRHQSSRYH